MEIDLSMYNISDVDKSIHLNQLIEKISDEHQFNWIIMSIAIFNILELNPSFNRPVEKEESEKDGIYFVGTLGEFKCYVDMYSPSNLLTIRYDKQISRDNKLKAILDNVDIVTEINIEVNY